MAKLSEAEKKWKAYIAKPENKPKYSVRNVQALLRDNYRKHAGRNYNENKYASGIQEIKKKYPSQFASIQEINEDNNLRLQNVNAFDTDSVKKDPISRRGLRDIEFMMGSPYGFDRSELPGKAGGAMGTMGKNGVKVSGLADDEEMKYILRHEGQHRMPAFYREEEVRHLDSIYNKIDKPSSQFMKNVVDGYGDNANTEAEVFRISNLILENEKKGRSEGAAKFFTANPDLKEPTPFKYIVNRSPEKRLELFNNADVFKKNKHYIEPR